MTDFDLFNYYHYLCSPVWIRKGAEKSNIACRDTSNHLPSGREFTETPTKKVDFWANIRHWVLLTTNQEYLSFHSDIHFIRSYPFLLTVSYKTLRLTPVNKHGKKQMI